MRKSKNARLVSTAVADARRNLREIESKRGTEQKGGKRNAIESDLGAVEPLAQAEQGWMPRVGDSVFVPSIQSHAVVEKIVGDKLTLRKGMLTMSKIGIDQVQRNQ